MYQLLRLWAVFSTVTAHLGQRKKSFKLMHLLLSCLKVFFTQVMKNVFVTCSKSKVNCSSKNLCYTSTNHLVFSDIVKCLNSGVTSPSDQNRSVLSCLCVCAFYPSDSVGRLVTGVLSTFSILVEWKPMCSNNFPLIHSAPILSIASKRFSSPIESCRCYLLQSGSWS